MLVTILEVLKQTRWVRRRRVQAEARRRLDAAAAWQRAERKAAFKRISHLAEAGTPDPVRRQQRERNNRPVWPR